MVEYSVQLAPSLKTVASSMNLDVGNGNKFPACFMHLSTKSQVGGAVICAQIFWGGSPLTSEAMVCKRELVSAILARQLWTLMQAKAFNTDPPPVIAPERT